MDYYKILEVEKTATQDEIKKSYRKLVMIHHPDRPGGDITRFQEISVAYETLSDDAKRAAYDQPNPFNPAGFSQHSTHFDLNDILAAAFAQQFNQQFNRQPQRQVYRTQVHVSLVDAFNGASQTFQIKSPTGTKVISISIPVGCETGDCVRYEDLIEEAALIAEFVVMSDRRYDRRGNNLYSNHRISILDLIVGTVFQFETIDGKTLDVTIPPGSQPNQQIRLTGQGMTVKGNPNSRGDQIVLLNAFTPDTIHTSVVEAIKTTSTPIRSTTV